MVDLRKGRAAQGGSTLTQQLVKNVFLTQDRRLFRKIREAVIAVASRFSIPSETSSRDTSTPSTWVAPAVSTTTASAPRPGLLRQGRHRADPAGAATLAGMIKSPAVYSPLASPARSRRRRDEVLAAHGRAEVDRRRRAGAGAGHSHADLADASRCPAGPTLRGRHGNRGPRPFSVSPVWAAAATTLFATLSIREQDLARKAAGEVLQESTAGAARRRSLEAALISVDPTPGRSSPMSAAATSVVASSIASPRLTAGGELLQAHRPRDGPRERPALAVSILQDEPLTLKTGAGPWSPKNADGQFLGPVTVRKAVEQSRNVPLIRLAMDVGVAKVASTAHRMASTPSWLSCRPGPGRRRRDAARDGDRLLDVGQRRSSPVLHGLATVLGPDGKPVREPKPKQPEQVVSPRWPSSPPRCWKEWWSGARRGSFCAMAFRVR